MDQRLANKVAVITGAASGIGAATAKTFVEHGARVVLGDIQDELGASLAEALGGADHATFCHCDVTDEQQVEAMVETAVSQYGGIDIMFNCAGIVGAVGPMSTTPAAEWKLTIDIMLNGVFYGMKHASRHMKAAGSGSIISMSSTAGVMGGLGPHAYAAAKHAVVGMTKNLAAEVGSWLTTWACARQLCADALVGRRLCVWGVRRAQSPGAVGDCFSSRRFFVRVGRVCNAAQRPDRIAMRTSVSRPSH